MVFIEGQASSNFSNDNSMQMTPSELHISADIPTMPGEYEENPEAANVAAMIEKADKRTHQWLGLIAQTAHIQVEMQEIREKQGEEKADQYLEAAQAQLLQQEARLRKQQ